MQADTNHTAKRVSECFRVSLLSRQGSLVVTLLVRIKSASVLLRFFSRLERSLKHRNSVLQVKKLAGLDRVVENGPRRLNLCGSIATGQIPPKTSDA